MFGNVTVCDALAQRSFCWKFLCVCVWCTGPIKVYVGNVSLCVMYWSYKSLCWKCFSVCVWCTGPIKVYVVNVSVCVWCTGHIKVYVGNVSVCVWCTGPIKVYVENVSVCVMYWPCKSYCFNFLCRWCYFLIGECDYHNKWNIFFVIVLH